MHWHVLLPFIDEFSTIAPDLGRVGTGHSVDEFSEGARRDGDLDFSEGVSDRREQILDRLPLPFLRNDYAGVEDQSQEGGFHGWLRSLIPSSTSLPKPLSRVTFDP